MTLELFREDSYLKQCEATVISVGDNFIVLDQTVFYPLGGGQPGDTGRLVLKNKNQLNILDTRKNPENGEIQHFIAENSKLPVPGEQVSIEIDWNRRYKIMRLHSCMHMLCSVVPESVTGGNIRDDGSARLDFDIPDPPDKLAIEAALNALTNADHPMSTSWITDKEMEKRPELVRTMSVQPPMGQGRVRLVNFEDVDLQPCGGTHVANANEIGNVLIRSIKKKGKLNRRITVELI